MWEWKKRKNHLIDPHSLTNLNLLVTSSIPFVRIRSISICGAVTASELNTCNRDRWVVEFRRNSSLLVQFIWKENRKSFVKNKRKCCTQRQSLTVGHNSLQSWTPQVTCNRSRSGNLNAGKVALNNFSTISSLLGWDHPSSMYRLFSVNAGITLNRTIWKEKKKIPAFYTNV